MAASFRNKRARAAALLVLPLLYLGVASAAELRTGDAFSYEADVVTTDLRSQTLEISGNVRVTDGTNSIQSDAAKAIGPTANSRWSFQKAVRIVTAEAQIDADSADATVVGGQLSRARVQGSPAQFQQRGSSADRQIRGRGGVVEYDFAAGVATLTDQVWFSNGKDEFRGDSLIYNVRDQRVQSQGRVRGVISPKGKTSVAPPSQPKPESGE